MRTRALARPLLCVVAFLTIAGGCADPPTEQADAPPTIGQSTAATGTASSPASPSGSATGSTSAAPPSSVTGSDTASATAPTSPGPLLSAAELPGFTDHYRWRPGATGTVEPATFGTCQRFGLIASGAERVVVRRFLPPASSPTGEGAGELVATFPDAQTARRVYSVLTAWRARCADRLLDYDSSDVGDLQDVSVDSGQAGWYLLTYGPPPGDARSKYFDAQGMAMVGSRIALVTMRLNAEDFSYPSGQAPMVAAVQRAAQKLS